MKAMILAAGRGERMRPLTDLAPKPLLRVRGKPLIEWHIERLRSAGFRDIVVNVSWLKQQLLDFLGDGSHFGVRISISEEPAGALETAGGIRQAIDLLGDRFLVVNGDIWTDFDFARLAGLPRNNDLAHLVLVPNPEYHPAGDFSLVDGRVESEKKDNSTVENRHTFSGIGVYRCKLFTGLEPGVRKLAPVLREASLAGLVSGEVHAGAWSDIGTPQRLAELE